MKQQTALQTEAPNAAVITSQTITQEITDFFKWWYVEMPVWYVGFVQRIITLCDDTFSISLLLKTFFVPWHRDNTWLGHLFGMVIRILYLPIAISITTVVLAIIVCLAVIWAILPVVTVIFIFNTIRMI